MVIIFLLLFCCSLVLVLYENHWIVHSWPRNRPEFYNHKNQVIIVISRLILLVISIAGLWYTTNFFISLIALISYLIIGTIYFKISYNRKLSELTNYYIGINKEIYKDETNISETDLINLSIEKAKERILKNMRCID